MADLRDLLSEDSLDPTSKRMRALEREYGATLIYKALLDVVVGMMISSGFVKREQLVEHLEKTLKHQDERRRARAGYE